MVLIGLICHILCFISVSDGLPYSDARDNSFSRSRSSSVTSIDRESREVISSFYFCDSLSKKSELVAVPSLWVGTSLGSMLAIALAVPSTPEQRMQQSVGISFCGKTVLRFALRMDILKRCSPV